MLGPVGLGGVELARMIGGEADGNELRPVHIRRGVTSAPGYRAAAAELPRARGRFADLCMGGWRIFGGAGESSQCGQRPDGHFRGHYSRLRYTCPLVFCASWGFCEDFFCCFVATVARRRMYGEGAFHAVASVATIEGLITACVPLHGQRAERKLSLTGEIRLVPA